MELTLRRDFDNHKSTLSRLYINGSLFCMGLEDRYRETKVKGETRIPFGRYEIKLRFDSPMAARYESKYGTNGMLWLQDVKGFDYIYIHIGNHDDDSQGCILVGESRVQTAENGRVLQMVTKSTKTYKDLHKIVSSAIAKSKVYITILD